MARAIISNKVGGEPVDVLQLVLKEKPRPGPGQVLVQITVRPINPSDLINIRTRYFSPDREVTFGGEGFGIVEEVGEGVTKFKEGQRVIPILWYDFIASGQGSWQDYVVVTENKLLAVPDNVSDEVAAQFIVNPWTTYAILDDLCVPKGEYIVQTAAASVLGRQVIQLARHWGFKTINIVRRDKWKQELQAIGADEVINSNTEDVVERVKEITGGKLAHAAIDAVGGHLTKTVAMSLRDGGKVFVYGLLSGWDITLGIQDLMRGIEIRWWVLFHYTTSEEKELYLASEVMKLIESKVITPAVGKKFKLEDFQEAIKEAEMEGRGGKVLLIS